MKTYFMAWECDNKRGHTIYDFSGDVTPREVLRTMIDFVKSSYAENEEALRGEITATQFNRVD